MRRYSAHQSKSAFTACRGVFFATLALLISGCKPFALGPGVDDFSADLLNSYTLNRTSAHKVYISWQGGLADGVPCIPSKVLECAVHPPFILGKRQGLKLRSNDGAIDKYEEPDPDVLDYWILDTSVNGKSYGPMDFHEFMVKRRTLGIPESLSLRDVYTYRK